MSASDSEDSAVRTITRQLTQIRDGFFVAEHALARCSDPVVQSQRSRRFCYQDEVYYWLDSRVELTDVRHVLRNGRSWLNTTFATKRPRQFDLRSDDHDVPINALSMLAETVILIGVSAWDGEGYIFWLDESEEQ